MSIKHKCELHYPLSSKLTLSPVENIFQNKAAEKYRNDVSNKNPLNEPINSTKKPAPTVPTIAASVPAVLDIPTRNTNSILACHQNSLTKTAIASVPSSACIYPNISLNKKIKRTERLLIK